MTVIDVHRLREIAEVEFDAVVLEAYVPDLNELRIFIQDGSFVDVWFSLKLSGRYSYHWERKAIDGTIYRHDNAPHQRWQSVSTFPHHFHDGSEDHVIESYLSAKPEDALREFLTFVQKRLQNTI
ncbi:MAG: DUF6516 family protein [Chloroflexi bacterium]|nr:DUF6516 family protein [Chloroflexota bacterium]